MGPPAMDDHEGLLPCRPNGHFSSQGDRRFWEFHWDCKQNSILNAAVSRERHAEAQWGGLWNRPFQSSCGSAQVRNRFLKGECRLVTGGTARSIHHCPLHADLVKCSVIVNKCLTCRIYPTCTMEDWVPVRRRYRRHRFHLHRRGPYGTGMPSGNPLFWVIFAVSKMSRDLAPAPIRISSHPLQRWYKDKLLRCWCKSISVVHLHLPRVATKVYQPLSTEDISYCRNSKFSWGCVRFVKNLWFFIHHVQYHSHFDSNHSQNQSHRFGRIHTSILPIEQMNLWNKLIVLWSSLLTLTLTWVLRVTFYTIKSGTYNIAAKWIHWNIPKDSATMTVNPADVHPPFSTLSGEPLQIMTLRSHNWLCSLHNGDRQLVRRQIHAKKLSLFASVRYMKHLECEGSKIVTLFTVY